MFRERVEELKREAQERVQRFVIARRSKRAELLQTLLDDLLAIKVERAKLPISERIAGGKTGLVTRTDKIIGAGGNAKLVHEDALDEVLLRAIRDVLTDARKELGEGSGIELESSKQTLGWAGPPFG